jgi:low affinity Fe/Cu permease
MNPFQTAIFLIFTLPGIMIQDGYHRLEHYLKEKDEEWKLPYMIAMAICILLIIILLVTVFI